MKMETKSSLIAFSRKTMRQVIRHICTLTFVLVGGLLCSEAAFAEGTSLQYCYRDALTGADLQDCMTIGPIEGPLPADLIDPGDRPWGDGGRCSFLFWTVGGIEEVRVGPKSSLEASPIRFEIPNGMHGIAVAFFSCGTPCPKCPDRLRVKVIGINVTNGQHVPAHVIEAVDPDWASGNCLSDNPCTTREGISVNSLTARSEAAGLVFLEWFDDPTRKRMLNLPHDQSSRQFAFYKEKDFPLLDPIIGPFLPCKFRFLEGGLDLFKPRPDDVPGEIPPLCRLPLGNVFWPTKSRLLCEAGQCPNLRINLDGALPFDIRVLDRDTGKVITEAQRTEQGVEIRFQPKSGPDPGVGYFLTFERRKDWDKYVPKGARTIPIFPRITTESGKTNP